ELESLEEKWYYLLRHLSEWEERPKEMGDSVFDKLFSLAELSLLSRQERELYEDSLKYYRDVKNTIDTAREEGFNEGRAEGLREGMERGRLEERLLFARRLLEKGFSVAQIAELTGLDERELLDLIH
ncbi:MAG: Rpn family recombination-promoting nuclease/putative transposase, partial [Cytophagales bacterium]|nr:Rpn family recombination-promoting nuclease/putative transposase [Cytophagales bacterium]